MVSAPLLKRSLYRTAPLGAVNLHFGVAPRYRGENTLFWALRERNPAGLGVTFHRIDDGIDTGPVMAWGFPRLFPRMTEETVWLDSIDLACRMAGRVVAEMKPGIPSGKGRLYPMRRRQPWHDLLEYIFPYQGYEREEFAVV